MKCFHSGDNDDNTENENDDDDNIALIFHSNKS